MRRGRLGGNCRVGTHLHRRVDDSSDARHSGRCDMPYGITKGAVKHGCVLLF